MKPPRIALLVVLAGISCGAPLSATARAQEPTAETADPAMTPAEPQANPADEPPPAVEPTPDAGAPADESEDPDASDAPPTPLDTGAQAIPSAVSPAKPRPAPTVEVAVDGHKPGRSPAGSGRARKTLDPGDVCAGSLNPQRCTLAAAGLTQACAAQADPAGCEQAVLDHACVQAPVSIECFSYLVTRPCLTFGTSSFECRLWSGLKSVYCSKTSGDIDCSGPTCCFVEPIAPDDPRAGDRGTLTSDRGDPLGIVDPGGLGDRGLEARPQGRAGRRQARGHLPFTGGALLGMLIAGLGLLAVGSGARATGRPTPQR